MAAALTDHLSEAERDKYQRMWELDSYRERSPGHRMAEKALGELGCSVGNTLCDWGCGTGRAAASFQERGLNVTGIDIAPNAAREFDGPVVVACMWDMPPDAGPWDFGTCADVMEHIPPERVLQTLTEIRRLTRRRAWFSIARFIDREGERIGETLHLSIRPVGWWAESFERAGWRHFRLEPTPKHISSPGMRADMRALVLGGAGGVWAEMEEAKALGYFDVVVAVNYAGRDHDGRVDHWVSFHAELFPTWIRARRAKRLPDAGAYWSTPGRRNLPGVDLNFVPLWGGSSGLMAVQVALTLGCRRVVICGIPLDAEAEHYDRPGLWTEADKHRNAWMAHLGDLSGAVRSMSGWTRALLGAPTREWFSR